MFPCVVTLWGLIRLSPSAFELTFQSRFCVLVCRDACNREQDRETHVSVNATAPARRRAHVNAHRVRAVARAFSQVVSTSRCRLAAHGGPHTMASGRCRPPTSLRRPRHHGIRHARWQAAGLDSYQPMEAPTPWHRTCALAGGRFRLLPSSGA